MANAQTILKVFISSPTDLESEREAIVTAIEEFNTTWSTHFGTRLEPVRWETNTRPAAGSDAQKTINRQISNGYDVFVGMMWKRFGTKTPRFGSGTEEEFEIAYHRYKKNKKSVSLLTYFKDKAIPPSEIDPKQLERINAFKKKLKSKGVFYHSYKSLDEFQKLIRMHLSFEVQAWQTRINQQQKSKQEVQPDKAPQKPSTKLNPEDFKKQSDQSATTVRGLMEEYHAALGDYLKYLESVSEAADVSENISNTISADKYLCDRLEPILGAIVSGTDVMIRAWIDEFNVEFLNGNAKKGNARDLLRRFRNLSKVLRDQAKLSNFEIPMDEVLLAIPRFVVSHKRLVTLFRTVSYELDFAAKMLSEAAETVEKFIKKTKK